MVVKSRAWISARPCSQGDLSFCPPNIDRHASKSDPMSWTAYVVLGEHSLDHTSHFGQMHWLTITYNLTDKARKDLDSGLLGLGLLNYLNPKSGHNVYACCPTSNGQYGY